VLSVIGAVFAEWVASYQTGLGYLILELGNETATAEEFAAVVLLAVIGIALFALVGPDRAPRAPLVPRRQGPSS
jgi:ABC-type nitrate/sulfonate/bicarbonate transport system permease component